MDVILTDKTKDWLDLRETLRGTLGCSGSSEMRTCGAHLGLTADYDRIMQGHSSTFLWTSPRYYFVSRKFWETLASYYLQKFGGPAKKVDEIEDGPVVAISPGAAGAVKA